MSEDKSLSPAEMFLKYEYPETKDLCKQFLTLITTVLVISLTFSEKIVVFKDASTISRWLVITSWISFLCAIILCGLGLLLVTIAGGEAAFSKYRNSKRANTAYKMIVTAGLMFILGLVLLIGTAITSTTKGTAEKMQTPIKETSQTLPDIRGYSIVNSICFINN